MEPTQPTSPHAPTPNAGAPLVEYIRTQRQNAGYLLAFLSVVFLALTAFLALKAYRAPAAAEKPADKSLVDPFDPEKPTGVAEGQRAREPEARRLHRRVGRNDARVPDCRRSRDVAHSRPRAAR